MPRTNYCRDPAKDAMDSLKDLIFGTGANTRSDKHYDKTVNIV